MKQSETIAKLAADLALAQAKLRNATENADSMRNHRYATLAHVRNCTAPILSEHGLTILQGTTYDGAVFTLTTRLLHKSGEWIEGTYPLPIDKNSQVMGSAMTYGRRYCWTSMLGIDDEAAQDDDGEATRPDIPLGMVKGDGPTRFASHPLSAHLQDEMKTKTLLDDLQQWWIEKEPSRKRLNSENKHLLFMEFMKQGFELAPAALDLRVFLKLHKEDIGALEKRSQKEYEGLLDHYDKAKARFQTEEVG